MYGGKPGAAKSGNSRKGSLGLQATPGTRGDGSNASGRAGLSGKSPDMPAKLASECSKGYESPNGGWHGNVKR